MEIKVINEKENPLFERKELEIRVAYEGPTPKRDEIRNALLALLNSSRDLLILDSLRTRFGTHELAADVRIYKSKEATLGTEPKYVLARNFPELAEVKEKKPVEKKEEAAKERKAKPAEAKPPEKKEEKKKEAAPAKKEQVA